MNKFQRGSASSPQIFRRTDEIASRCTPDKRLFMTTGTLGLGEYTVTLTKPLGVILEECEAGNSGGGVQVASFAEGGAAVQHNEQAMRNNKSGVTMIVRGDRLVRIGNEDVSTYDFDSVMNTLIDAPADEELCLTLSDGLGRMDMAPNLAKKLDTEDAILIDEVVRAAVREIRFGNSPQAQSLGDLLKVEIVIGAGVRKIKTEQGIEGRRCQVRFFAIFSRDTVTTFSCSVSATGIKQQNGSESVDIVALSCAKDEGW
eukprot:CAMPEP_0204629862 /NCGR_PEP_ID=MMETSP0717-20131115/19064_1 /ASSEMBLY_ACC=CAM_ASM_000666 /TAXON_ID=230516 /ORGANISM="Chaetoceros curvisetus" /LENGTH=257 /DNA_ID=CAMNT_0051646919 /DNA_START=403 /DNA_END=1173 /DNA_ORIENTATION=+